MERADAAGTANRLKPFCARERRVSPTETPSDSRKVRISCLSRQSSRRHTAVCEVTLPVTRDLTAMISGITATALNSERFECTPYADRSRRLASPASMLSRLMSPDRSRAGSFFPSDSSSGITRTVCMRNTPSNCTLRGASFRLPSRRSSPVYASSSTEYS